jgi:hypothetical protein
MKFATAPYSVLAVLLSTAVYSSGYAADQGGTGKAEPKAPIADLFTAVVKPGGGANCNSTPCTIYYLTPDLGAPVTVVANNFTAGTFEPWTYANLGNFSDVSVRIQVPGTDTPIAYVYLSDPGNSN